MYNDLAYTPFGIPYAQAGSTGVTHSTRYARSGQADISFAGNNEDITTSLYDAQFREYGIQGRWPSPDPAGIAANPANPQSWNRYAYVLNMPLLFVDPTGLHYEKACVSAGGTQTCSWVWYDDPFPADFAMSLSNPQGGPGLGGGPGGGAGSGSGSGPQTPTCTGLRKMAGQIGQSLQQAAKGLGVIAAASGIAAGIFSVGEPATFGLDTPGAITAGSFMSAAATGALVAEVAATGLKAYANCNLDALTNFNVSKLFSLAATLAASRLPFLNRFADTMGDAAEQAADLVNKAQGGCQ